MAHSFAVVPGDGIGPEVVAAARQVIAATGVAIHWVEVAAGESVLKRAGTVLPSQTLETIRRLGVALKGPLTNPVGSGTSSPNIELRSGLGLFVNVRVARHLDGAPSAFPGTDLVVIREVTEDLYRGSQQAVGEDAAIGVKVVTRRATERVADFAFRWARANGRRKVTIVHKAATLKWTDGLFLRTAQQVGRRYPEIECDEVMIDTLMGQIVRDPTRFDVLLTGYQYGDILSGLCAGLVGGPGLVPGAIYGDGVVLFEPAHGSAPKYAGQDRVNPVGTILSAAMLLQHVGETEAGELVRRAVQTIVREHRDVTADLGGTAKTSEMAAAIAEEVARLRAAEDP